MSQEQTITNGKKPTQTTEVKDQKKAFESFSKITKALTSEDTVVKKVTNKFKIELAKARNAKKLTQKQLAQQVNVHESAIRSYETGQSEPTSEILRKINNILGVSLKKDQIVIEKITE